MFKVNIKKPEQRLLFLLLTLNIFYIVLVFLLLTWNVFFYLVRLATIVYCFLQAIFGLKSSLPRNLILKNLLISYIHHENFGFRSLTVVNSICNLPASFVLFVRRFLAFLACIFHVVCVIYVCVITYVYLKKTFLNFIFLLLPFKWSLCQLNDLFFT